MFTNFLVTVSYLEFCSYSFLGELLAVLELLEANSKDEFILGLANFMLESFITFYSDKG